VSTYADFQEPLRLMSESVGPATDEQHQLATKVGMTLEDEPRAVAAALLEDHLEPAIWGTNPPDATDRQRQFLRRLGFRRAEHQGLTRRVASAWINHLLTLQDIHHLNQLQLKRNDAVIVRRVTELEGTRLESLEYRQVSSIAADGLLYFKGGNGKCARVQRVTKALPSDNPIDYPRFNELSEEST